MVVTVGSSRRRWSGHQKNLGPRRAPDDQALLMFRGAKTPKNKEDYEHLEIGHHGPFWVHRSPEGVRKLIREVLGQDPETLIVDQENNAGLLQVPESQIGEWVGVRGVVVGFISGMLGVSVEVVGKPERRAK